MNNIIKYAKENGFIVNNSLDLKDLGLSAYTAQHIEKGSLGDFLSAIETKKIETDGSAYLCIEQIDRLSRQGLDDAYQVFRRILKSNVNIITTMDKKIYTKKSLDDLISIMYSSVLMAQSHEESAKKSERVLKSFDDKKDKLDKGELIQYVGALPGWIENSGTKYKRNFIVNKKSRIVQRIFKMYISGLSMGDIARILNNENIEQVAKKRHKNFTNSWSSSKIFHVLNNRCVIGDLYIKNSGTIYKNYYPQIIDIDDWDIVQSMKKTRKIKKKSGKKSINIFSGKIFCSGCGQKYHFETDEKQTKKGISIYHMLKCSGRRVLNCRSKSIRYDDFIASTPGLFGMITSQKDDNKNKIKTIKKTIKGIYSETRKYEDKMLILEQHEKSGDLDFSIYLTERNKIQKAIKINDRRIADFKSEILRLSNDNKLENFDKTDINSINKAKIYIDEMFAGFIISSDTTNCTALYHNGQVIHYGLNNNNSNNKPKKLGLDEFYNLTNEILESYKSGKMDGKFIEILKATNHWGVITPESYLGIE